MTPKKSSARCCTRATARSTRSKRPTWSSTTPAPSATRPSRRSSTASPTTRSCKKQGKKFRRARLRRAAGRRKDFRARALCFAGLRLGVVPQSAADAGAASKPGKPAAITGLDDRETDECFETEFTARTNPHRGYITIIEGCDKFCAYCVVPFTRGKERSRTSDSVLAEARQMADLGYTEIQLLGQNVNSYKDPAGKKTFAELLAAVGEVPGIRRVRFTTSHPRDFGRDIVEAIDAVPTLCDHVHLPVQSGSTRVLDAMQRLYTRDQYLERIAWMKAAKRDISITTDIIVGFPGETEADFEETLSLLDEVDYDAVFAFKYSPRPNTPSLQLDDAIPDEEKSRRLTY